MILSTMIVAASITASPLEVGMKVPDVTLLNMKGESVSVSQFIGKKLIVFNWASW